MKAAKVKTWYVMEEQMGWYPIQEYGAYYSAEEAEKALDSFGDSSDANRWIVSVTPKPVLKTKRGLLVHKEW